MNPHRSAIKTRALTLLIPIRSPLRLVGAGGFSRGSQTRHKHKTQRFSPLRLLLVPTQDSEYFTKNQGERCSFRRFRAMSATLAINSGNLLQSVSSVFISGKLLFPITAISCDDGDVGRSIPAASSNQCDPC